MSWDLNILCNNSEVPLGYGSPTARDVLLLGLDVASLGSLLGGGKHPRFIPINGKDFLEVLDFRCSVLIFGDDMVSSVHQESYDRSFVLEVVVRLNL